jgi:hypothetical protein
MTKKTNTIKKTKTAAIESDALPLIMAETNPIVTLPKQRLVVRADFNHGLGSIRGNRKLNYCSLHAGTDSKLGFAELAESNFYNPRNLGGKRHNSANVAKYETDTAQNILNALMARADVVNGYLTGSGSFRSVWVAFASENPNQ